MNKTILGENTPGGMPGCSLGNPPSSEAGLTDSGGDHLLLISDPFKKSGIMRSPPNITPPPKKDAASFFEMEEPEQKTNMTRKERQLYEKLKKSDQENQELKDLIQTFQKKIKEMEIKIKSIEYEKNINENKKEEIMKTDYYTDEELLAEETEWIRVKNKKRKMNFTPSPVKKNTPSDVNQPNPKKGPVPPPIIVDGVKNYNSFYKQITESIPLEKFTIKLINKDNYKINVADGDVYREMTNIMKGCNWHSYENKQTRPIRVMVKKLHHSCEPEAIVEDLKVKKFRIIEAVNRLKWKTKEPLDMFMLTFDPNENINKIYSIDSILNCKVEVHALKSSKMLPQCKRCQAYEHTQKYCNKQPRCVKCAGKHLTKDCKKSADAKPKCVHCGEEHPANYRGCSVAKELQQLRNKKQNRKYVPPVKQKNQQIPNSQISCTEKRIIPQRKSEEKTYAQILTQHNDQKSEVSNEEIQKTLELILDKLEKQGKMINTLEERLMKLEYSNKGAIPKIRKNV